MFVRFIADWAQYQGGEVRDFDKQYADQLIADGKAVYAGARDQNFLSYDQVSGALVDGAGNSYPLARGVAILSGASAGADSGWLPINAAPERFAYQLDSGTTTTTFSIDISADGVTSLGQAFTGTWASSSLAEITQPIMFSNPLAKFFRWNVVSGGPLSVNRGM